MPGAAEDRKQDEQAASRAAPVFADYLRASESLPLEWLADAFPDFNAPNQQRTRRKTATMLAVTTWLLRTRSFADISVQEIAEKSDCSVTAIYARFKDKEAMLPIILFVILAVYSEPLDQAIDEGAAKDVRLEDAVRRLIDVYDHLFIIHTQFMVATMVGRVRTVHERIEMLIDALTDRFTAVLPPMPGLSEEELRHRVGLASRTILAIFRDRALLGEFVAYPDARTLSGLFCAILRMRSEG